MWVKALPRASNHGPKRVLWVGAHRSYLAPGWACAASLTRAGGSAMRVPQQGPITPRLESMTSCLGLPQVPMPSTLYGRLSAGMPTALRFVESEYLCRIGPASNCLVPVLVADDRAVLRLDGCNPAPAHLLGVSRANCVQSPERERDSALILTLDHQVGGADRPGIDPVQEVEQLRGCNQGRRSRRGPGSTIFDRVDNEHEL